MSNPYCEALGIEVPSLEDLVHHPEATHEKYVEVDLTVKIATSSLRPTTPKP